MRIDFENLEQMSSAELSKLLSSIEKRKASAAKESRAILVADFKKLAETSNFTPREAVLFLKKELGIRMSKAKAASA